VSLIVTGIDRHQVKDLGLTTAGAKDFSLSVLQRRQFSTEKHKPAVFELDLLIQRTSPASFGSEYLLLGRVKLTYHEFT